MSDFVDDCPICARATGGASAVVDIADLGDWTVCVPEGFEVPGWVFLELRSRHTEGLWSLSDEEAAQFGLLVRTISGAIREVTGADRVYLVAFGEMFPHFHVLLIPRLPDSAHTSTALFEARQSLRDVDAARSTALELAEALAQV